MSNCLWLKSHSLLWLGRNYRSYTLMVSLMDVDSACEGKRDKRKQRKMEIRCKTFLKSARSWKGLLRRIFFFQYVNCGTFEFRNILGIVITPPPSSSYTRDSSPTRRQAAPSTRIIRGFFTSDKQAIWLSLGLFEENMFICRLLKGGWHHRERQADNHEHLTPHLCICQY